MNAPTISPRQKVDAIQAWLEQFPAQLELRVQHFFFGGLYVRRMHIPQGTLLVGKVHRVKHAFALVEGKMAVWDETNGGMLRLRAPMVGISQPGARRVGYAFADSVWDTYHATRETDPETIEARVIAPYDFDRAAALRLLPQPLACLGETL